MRWTKYVGILSVAMVVLLLAAIPAASMGTSTSARGGKSGSVSTRAYGYKSPGVFEGVIRNATGAIHGRVVGHFNIWNGTGTFSGRWVYDGYTGVVRGVIHNGTFRGIWRGRGPGLRPHWGPTYGRLIVTPNGTYFRGRWIDHTTQAHGYVDGRAFKRPVVRGLFRGVWVKVTEENNTTSEIRGYMRGMYLYNPVSGVAHFHGRWYLNDYDHGYIRGIARNGHMYGIWIGRHGVGYLKGTYGNGTFQGRWYYRDGTPGGYFRGVYSRLPQDRVADDGDL